MMKKIVRSCAALMLLASASCAPNHHYLEVKSVIIPTSSDTGCKYEASSDSKETMVQGELPVTAQKFVIDNSDGAVTQLSYTVGLSAFNQLESTTQTNDANGRPLTTKDRSIIFANAVEVTFATVPEGISIPSATIPVSAAIEPGLSNAVVFDMITKEISDAILSQSKPFTLLPTFVITGTTTSGSSVESAPYTYKVLVTRPPDPLEADGSACGTVAGHTVQIKAGQSCKQLQDNAELVCAAPTTSGNGTGT